MVAVRVAWVSDDALITLRTALNISHSWGPGFNSTESVQAYTHPLWFLLWVGVGVVTKQWILGIISLGIVCVIIATALLMNQAQSIPKVIIAGGLLLLSNAFTDYTSSGLENPLSYAAVAVLIVLSLRNFGASSPRWSWSALVGLTSAAIFLTRMDLLALIAIPLAVLAWRYRRDVRSLLIGVGAFALPLVVWFTWAYLTYASFLPNTFAAKTNAEIPRTEFIVQGLRYLWVSFENDPVTLIGLATGIGIGIALGPTLLRAWALGALTYVGYVVWIGGDFMGGRFLAVPFFVAVFVLAASPLGSRRYPAASSASDNHGLVPILTATGAIGILMFATMLAGTSSTAFANPQEPRWEVNQNFNAGVVDARGTSVADADSLKHMVDNLSLAFIDPDFVPIGDGTGLGRALRNIDKSAANWPTNDGTFTKPSEVGVFCGYLGNIGIATGPTTHLINSCALTDRFLAERPFVPAEPFAWKPGHFHRGIPEGYVEAVTSDDPRQMADMRDAFDLEQLWNRIR